MAAIILFGKKEKKEKNIKEILEITNQLKRI